MATMLTAEQTAEVIRLRHNIPVTDNREYCVGYAVHGYNLPTAIICEVQEDNALPFICVTEDDEFFRATRRGLKNMEFDGLVLSRKNVQFISK